MIRRAWEKFLSWRLERMYRASVRRMQGCSHDDTKFVDVGMVYEKCQRCWALRIPALDGSDRMEWMANSAPPVK